MPSSKRLGHGAHVPEMSVRVWLALGLLFLEVFGVFNSIGRVFRLQRKSYWFESNNT